MVAGRGRVSAVGWVRQGKSGSGYAGCLGVGLCVMARKPCSVAVGNAKLVARCKCYRQVGGQVGGQV